MINDVQIDSRKVSQGAVFIAIKGEKADGHQFIDKAIGLGVSAIVCEVMPSSLTEGTTYVQVTNSQEAAAYISHNFYDEPSLKLKLVGVTGTNGKTTIATLLFRLFTALDTNADW
jgi:UDP-N-acetylmuramoyl-L-alanyl-D-glutamate--2,6-diaminopimelate ligase